MCAYECVSVSEPVSAINLSDLAFACHAGAHLGGSSTHHNHHKQDPVLLCSLYQLP